MAGALACDNRGSVKVLPYAALALAAVALAVIALRAPARDYVAPTAADVEAHHAAPPKLPAAIPAGCTVATIAVDGMCCTGCTGKLYDRLRATPGCVEAAVSFEDGLAQVVIREGADPEPFAAALRFEKYSATLKP